MSTSHWRDQLLADVHRRIDDGSFSIQYVLGEGSSPPWAYSIGFLAHLHPEVVVYGLDPESTGGVMHRLFAEIEQGIYRPVGRAEAQELGDPPLPLRMVDVPDHHWSGSDDLLCIAIEYYRAVGWDRSKLRARQLVWATPAGHFPWDPACDRRLARLQPLLDRPLRAV
jgi:hypothetical protein